MAKVLKKTFYEEYRARMARELSDFKDILKSSDFTIDLKPLEDAIADCANRKIEKSGEERWGYKIKNLAFNSIEETGNLRPRLKVPINIALTVDVNAHCCEEGINGDHFSSLAVNIVVSDMNKKYAQSWHFDRHIQGGNVPNAAHPIYHFQNGGKNVWDYPDEFFGSTLLVESPRISHPPMDGILAIDFVLSNFFGKFWRILSNDPKYKKTVETVQKRYWMPYAKSFHSTWLSPGFYDWDPIEIHPQLIRREAIPSSATPKRMKKKK